MGSYNYQYRYNEPEYNRQNANTDNDMNQAVILHIETLRKQERYIFIAKNGIIKSSASNVQIKVNENLQVSQGSRIELLIDGQKVEQAKVTKFEVVQISDTVFNSYPNAAMIIKEAGLDTDFYYRSGHVSRPVTPPSASLAKERPAGSGEPKKKKKNSNKGGN